MRRKTREFRQWLQPPEGIERASRKERYKRDGWMLVSTVGTCIVVLFSMGPVLGVASWLLVGNTPPMWIRWPFVGGALLVSFYIDANYVFPWGVERFDIVTPWQFREVNDGE